MPNTPSQQSTSDTVDGNLPCVDSGKTRVVAARVIKILQEHADGYLYQRCPA